MRTSYLERNKTHEEKRTSKILTKNYELIFNSNFHYAEENDARNSVYHTTFENGEYKPAQNSTKLATNCEPISDSDFHLGI